jgi:predicted nicotinamide N-methyase
LQNSDDETLGRCIEFPPEDDRPDEDELEILYPTTRCRFSFVAADHDDTSKDTIMIRQTSFGCGKLGHQVWSSSIALSVYLCSRPDLTQNQSIMELGAGCGLPSAVCRDVLGASSVLATDFWMVGDREKDRLIPENWHGINLEFNVVTSPRAKVQHVDWFNPDTVRQALHTGQPNIVVGSDLVYYPTDLEPFWNTIDICLKEGGVDEVILMSPLKPETREALPEFRKMLESRANEGYDINLKELTLHKDEIGNSVDRFLSMSIAME